MPIPQYKLTCERGIHSGVDDVVLTDIETGNRINGISKIELSIEPNDFVRAVITVVGVSVDASLLRHGVTVLDATVKDKETALIENDGKHVSYATSQTEASH